MLKLEQEEDIFFFFYSSRCKFYIALCTTDWPNLESDLPFELFREFCVRLNDCVPPQIWISEEGVETRAHYDAAHNYFTQIRGRKRFDLWPPSAHASLHLHSSLSSFARQPRDDIDLPLPHISVTLNPGDTLSLPAYWFHRVTALSPITVSISIWTESTHELDTKESIDKTPLPFETSWSDETKWCASLRFANQVLSFFEFPVVLRLLESRYENEVCPSEVSQLCLEFSNDTFDNFESRAKTIVEKFQTISSIHIREMYLWNWLESLAYFGTASNIHHVPNFLCALLA